jgi:DNA polymerase III subunit alpha
MNEFVHLHNHSDFSLLDGAAPIKGLVKKAESYGMKHLALTDHGNLSGALSFYNACRRSDINPVIGCEYYVAPGSRLVKTGSDQSNRYFHLVLLAKDYTGYKNLIELSSIGYIDGFYYKPRIDDEVLRDHADGLIALSACVAGEIPSAIIDGNPAAAESKALHYAELFGRDNFYLELQDHGLAEQKQANEGLIRLSKKTGIPLVVTNDIHYLERDHAGAQDILICIGTNKKRSDESRLRFESPEFYFKSPEEMLSLFPELPDAYAATVRIAEQCRLEIPLPGPQLPEYEIPNGFASGEEYMRRITYRGLEKLYPVVTPEIRDRTEHELDIIFKMNFTSYFLIVWDFIAFARKRGIAVGPGRGSGAGSIVAYAMRITDIDPLKYNLLFERFLNPERVSMPDFDIDFCFERRGEVIEYVTRKYGSEKVASICTFGTLKAKAVLKDVARVLDIPYAESNEITKLVPDGPKVKLREVLEQKNELQEYRKRGGTYRELIDTALILEGLNRHNSTHAAGIVIGRSKLTDYVPLYKDTKSEQISTGYTMDQLEDCGLIKMDFLGLKTLTLIENTVKLIRKRNPEFDIEAIPENDASTFEMLGQGNSLAVFQFESSGMQSILRQAKPNSIEDLIALNALYRPGPMQFIDQFVNAKNGKIPITYPHSSLETVLKPTYGVIVYQEQVMQVTQIIAGFSLGRADILRRAMGKKKIDVMQKEKVAFIEGAAKKGISKAKAEEIYEILIPFAGYGFNKSHAAAYSILAYKTAFLKANYPAEFMAANLTNEINSPDNFSKYMTHTKESKIPLLPPDINNSERDFTVVDGKIFYGLMGIKNVGQNAVEEIIRARSEFGEFHSLLDFLEKVDVRIVNRKAIETLIQAGLFDSMGNGRATLTHNLDRLMDFASKQKANREIGQTSLFDADDSIALDTIRLEEVPEWSRLDMLRLEKELLGYYFSGHPLDTYRYLWEKACAVNLADPGRINPEKTYSLVGIIRSLRALVTKRGQEMAVGELEDFNGSVKIVIFPKTWEAYRHLLEPDAIVGIEGKIKVSDDVPEVLVDKVVRPDDLKAAEPSEVHIKINHGPFREDDLYSLRSIMIDSKGPCTVFLHLDSSEENRETVIRASSGISISPDPEAIDRLQSHPRIQEVWKT